MLPRLFGNMSNLLAGVKQPVATMPAKLLMVMRSHWHGASETIEANFLYWQTHSPDFHTHVFQTRIDGCLA